MYRCALFDIDNTLLIKKPTIAEIVYELAARENPSLTMDEAEKAYAESELWQGQQIQKENETGVRMADEEYLENVTGIYRRALGLGEKACQSLTELFGRDYKKEYQLMPGTKELLGRLQAEGLSLGIVSNNHSGVRKVLAGMGLEGFFGCMVISEEVNLYKPDPRILQLACEKLGTAPGESVYVGDHPFDVLCAHSAGMAAAWLPANRFMEIPAFIGPPDYTISSLHEAAGVLLGEAYSRRT